MVNMDDNNEKITLSFKETFAIAIAMYKALFPGLCIGLIAIALVAVFLKFYL